MTAYIKSLQRMLEEEALSTPAAQTSSLEERFLAWFETIPEISRLRPYSMVEIERALSTQGRYISPIMLRLGWKRRRKWSSEGQYHRYWVPPSCTPLP